MKCTDPFTTLILLLLATNSFLRSCDNLVPNWPKVTKKITVIRKTNEVKPGFDQCGASVERRCTCQIVVGPSQNLQL